MVETPRTAEMAAQLGISTEMLRTSEIAERFGTYNDEVLRWKKRGAPCIPKYFPRKPLRGGPRVIGWDPDKISGWLKKKGLLGEDGKFLCRKPGRQDTGICAARAAEKARADALKAELRTKRAKAAEDEGILTTSAMAAELGISKGLFSSWKRQGAPCRPKLFPPPCAVGGGVWGTGWDPDKLRTWLKKEGRMDENGTLISRQSGKRLMTPAQSAKKKAAKLAAKDAAKAQAKGGLLTTQEMADLLNVTTSRLHRWANQCGAPHIKHHFPPTRLPGAAASGGQRGNAWYPDKLIAWLKKEGRMDENGALIETPKEQAAKVGPEWSGPDPELSARVAPLALPHLLAAFAHACQGGGIPAGLSNKLVKAGIEELHPDAIKMIEDMAKKHQRTEMQWVMIKGALPALTGKDRRKRKGVPNDE